MNKTILAIVGLPGAGKTEATKYAMEKTGWPKVYFGQIVMDEIQKRGLTLNEDNEKFIREDLRIKYGMAAFAILSLPKIQELFKNSSVILESLYSWEEYLVIEQEFGVLFKVLAIYASPDTRIRRLKSRVSRPLTPDEVKSRDYSQIANLHQAGPIARADFTIVNEGTPDEMFQKIDEVLKTLIDTNTYTNKH